MMKPLYTVVNSRSRVRSASMVALRISCWGKCTRLSMYLSQYNCIRDSFGGTYGSGTGIDHSLVMNRFVVRDWDAARARLISRAPDSGEFT